MSLQPVSLWPQDLIVVGDKAPVTILREQATALGNQTKNLLEGYVERSHLSTASVLFYTFQIIAPAVGGYKYDLFVITHDVVHMYPVLVSYQTNETVCANEVEFRERLGHIFSSEHTLAVVRSLLAQSMG